MDLRNRAHLLHNRVESFNAAWELEERNYEALIGLIRQAFKSKSAIKLIDRRRQWMMELAYRELRVLLFNYVSSVVAFVNQMRKGSKKDPKQGVYELFATKHAAESIFRYVTDNFEQDPVHGLVLEIRNVCTHHRLPNPTVSLSLKEGQAKVIIPKDFLLDVGEIRGDVRRYIEGLSDEIELTSLILQHHDKLMALHGWVHEKIRGLWCDEIAFIENERKRSFENAKRFLLIELNDAFGKEKSAIVDRLQFTLAGALSPAEQIQLIPLEQNKKQWVLKALQLINQKANLSDEIVQRIRQHCSSDN